MLRRALTEGRTPCWAAPRSPYWSDCSWPPHPRQPPRRRSGPTASARCATCSDRSAVTVAGAAIVEVDHAEVVVTANRRAVRRMRRMGYTVDADGDRAPAAPPRGGRAADVPAGRLRLPRLRRDGGRARAGRGCEPPVDRSASAIGTSYQGRTIWAVKISDNVATDENEPEVLFTAHQHAREHLTVEMALVPARTGSPTATRPTPGSPASSTAARSGSSRSSTRTAASTTSPPAPTARGARTASPTPARATSAPTSTATGATSGAAAAAHRARTSSETYRGPSAFSAPETAARARLRPRPRRSAASSRSRRTSTSTPTPS